MRFLEDARLNRISVLLRHFDVGDRVLNGCLELFTTKEKVKDERKLGVKVNHELQCQNDKWLSHSPLGPMQKDEVKELLTNLLSTMNQCFPDYDFSSLSPERFSRQYNFADVYNNINFHLSFFVERYIPGFLHDLWAAIKGAVELENVEIYSCRDPHEDEAGLFAFDYFFFDKRQQKILLFSCFTKSKYAESSTPGAMIDSSADDDDDDDYLEGDSNDEAEVASSVGSPVSGMVLSPSPSTATITDGPQHLSSVVSNVMDDEMVLTTDYASQRGADEEADEEERRAPTFPRVSSWK